MSEAYMPLSKASRETGIAEAELRALCEGDSLDWHGTETDFVDQPYWVKSSDVARYIASRPAGTVNEGRKSEGA